MKKLFVLLAFLAGPMAIATAASAQTPSAQRFASCLIQAHPEKVRELLRATSVQAANRPYHFLADDDRCLASVFGNQSFRPDETAVSVAMLRGRLAEQELLRQSQQVAALQALPLQKAYSRPWFAATERHPEVDEMATCIADTDPAGIMAIIRTTPGFAGEGAAFAALSPSLTKCLAAGTRLDASPEALRAALADALYQRLNNPALSTAPTGGTVH